MITLHHLEYSQSFRILWLLEELGADYSLEKYKRNPKTHLACSRYRAISPLGTAPVITEGQLALAETNAIVDYLLDKFPNTTLRPQPGSKYRTQYLFWLHSAQGSMTPLLLIDTVLRMIIKRSPFIIRPLIRPILNQALSSFVKPRIDKLLQLAETTLGATNWFGGERMTAADIVLAYTLESAKSRNYVNNDHPHCLRWLEQINHIPSFQKAREKDGKSSIVFWNEN